MDSVGSADPTTVLSAINTGISNLQVPSVPTSSEPTTPSSESPLSLDAGLREWLTEALVANSTNPKVYTKLLVSNAAAGSVIGKAGGNINDVQAKTYARIQLSKANEYYPGTTERTLLVTGRLKQVVAALGLIFAKLVREGVAPLSPRSKAATVFPRAESGASGGAASAPAAGAPEAADGTEAAAAAAAAATEGGAPAPLRLLVRLLVPQPLCGVIIGKNGATIRNYASDTGTVIRVTSGEASQAPTSHRIVTIAGEQEGLLKAIALMTLKQSDDPKFPLYGELPTPAVAGGALGMHPMHGFGVGAGPGGMPMGLSPQFHAHHLPPHYLGASHAAGGGPGSSPVMYGGGGGMPFGPHSSGGGVGGGGVTGEGYTSASLMLTEDQTSVLIDQGGRAVAEVEQMSGCRARLDMADGPRGSYGRLLLAGAPESLACAQWLLGQRLAAAAASYQMGGTTYYHSFGGGGSGPGNGGGYVAAGPPGIGYMSAAGGPWQPGMMSPSAAQQQHMMAAAAGMIPQPMQLPMAVRQHSGSSDSSPGAH